MKRARKASKKSAAADVPLMNRNPRRVETAMQTHAPSLTRYAERLVRDPHAARDVVQQVFIRFARIGPDQEPAPEAERAWLYRSTHNRAVDWIRAERRRDDLHATHAEQRALEGREELNAMHADVLRWVHLLKEKERAVLLLRLEEGLSYREIADVTGLKEGHVGYLLHQAVRTLGEHVRRPEVAS